MADFLSKTMEHDVQSKTKLEENRLNIDVKIGDNQEKSGSMFALPPSFRESENKDIKVDRDSQHEGANAITVFISNLDYTTTEEQVRNSLKTIGPITLFRMVKDYKGCSKGFCYVQFNSVEAVEKALKLDGTTIRGCPMFISRCDPNKSIKSSGFKYSYTLEKDKLYVKGLPLTTIKKELEEIFKVHELVKEIRLVTYRNDRSNSHIAYVRRESSFEYRPHENP